MSYRDLRSASLTTLIDFSETMRALGFPQPISVESFREPNFPLVEQLLRWLGSRFDPDTTLRGSSHSVEERVALVRDATGFFLSKANVKLVGRRVYGADGWAVKELSKVAALLREAADIPFPDSDSGRDLTPSAYDITNKLSEIKQARQLSTEITAQGSFLYDLLAKEPNYKSAREQALSRPLELSTMESSIRAALDATRARVEATRDHIHAVAATEAALDAKIDRRRAELLRAEKRLHTQQKIKPAYQSELTALESEIEGLWEQYVLRYRCVEALKHQLAVLESTQADAAEEQQAAIMQLITKYEAEDVLGKLSDSDEDEPTSGGATDPDPVRSAARPHTRLRIKTAGTGRPGAERRVFGTMVAGDSLDDELDLSDDDDDTHNYQDIDEVPSRWSRSARPRPARPATRTLAQDEHLDQLIREEGKSDSLESSSESELRAVSAAPPSAAASALSDNEF